MKNDLMMEFYEQKELEQKANSFDDLQTICYNAIVYMLEQGLTIEEVAEYVGSSVEALEELDVV